MVKLNSNSRLIRLHKVDVGYIMTAKFVILAENGYEDSELTYPYYRLKELSGIEVVIVSSTPEITSKYGNPPMKVGAQIADLPAIFDSCCGVLIPGGFESPEKLRQNDAVKSFVKKMNDSKRIVAAICHGPWVLISSGIVSRGMDATCYPGMRDDLINAGANYHDSPVVTHENIITGRRPRDLADFTKVLVSKIEECLGQPKGYGA
jgi:protease I